MMRRMVLAALVFGAILNEFAVRRKYFVAARKLMDEA